MVWLLTFRVENVFEKKMKKLGLWDRGMVTGEPGQKPYWKKNDLVCQTVIWSLGVYVYKSFASIIIKEN